MTPELLDKDVYSPGDLLGIADGHRYDLVDGSLLERDMGPVSSWVGGELYARLRDHCRAGRVGWVWHADAGFELFSSRMVRYPDVAVVRYGRLPNEVLPDGHIKLPPDLVAEVVSPRDRADDLEEKLRDYRKAGVRLVWVIFPAVGMARVHRPDRTVTEIGVEEILSGEDVLPGFQVRLGDLFPNPPELPQATGAPADPQASPA